MVYTKIISQKNICILIRTLGSGGAEKQSALLAQVLQENHKVFLVILQGNISEQNEKILENDNINIIILTNSNLFSKGIEFYKILKKNKINIIFSYLASCNFLNAFVGIIAGIPYRIGGIRNTKLSFKKLPFERFFHNHLLLKSISNSQSAVKALVKLGFQEDKFHVIYNGFNLNVKIIERKEKKVINILSVARFVLQKDYITALKTIKLLRLQLESSKFNFMYNIVGYGVLENEIKKNIYEFQLDDIVNIVIKPKNLISYFEEADIFFSTSLFEGMSNSVMEALSYTLPVIATKAGDMDLLVKDGENGFLCDIKNPTQMAEKIEILIKDNKLRWQMGKTSYKFISEEFTLKKFKEDYLIFINNLFNNSNNKI